MYRQQHGRLGQGTETESAISASEEGDLSSRLDAVVEKARRSAKVFQTVVEANCTPTKQNRERVLVSDTVVGIGFSKYFTSATLEPRREDPGLHQRGNAP